jgi:hypothetical protein
MANDNCTPFPLNPSVPVNLDDSKKALFNARACLAKGSLLWFIVDMAYQLVSRAISEIETMKKGGI